MNFHHAQGNIRVYCRVRPLLSKEKRENENTDHLDFADCGKTLTIKEVIFLVSWIASCGELYGSWFQSEVVHVVELTVYKSALKSFQYT